MDWFRQARKTQQDESLNPKSQSTGSCPVAHDEGKMRPETANDEAAPKCPVDTEGGINPRNFMPTYSQRPLASQKGALPTQRTTSTIPKAEDDDEAAAPATALSGSGSKLWEYPSPQQFFNAVMKKGFTQTQEEDVPAMVEIHNAVNERAWQEILAWERESAAKCGGVKLVKFRGDSKHVTPKARMLSFLGYSRPFDTHFWTIDRCGERVEYVIDFYKGRQPRVDADMQTAQRLQMPSFYLDVRPMGIEGFPARLKRACGM